MARTADAEVQAGFSKKDRKAFAREQARIRRELERKRRRRNRILGWTGFALGLVAALAVAALIVVATVRAGLVGPLNMRSDGVLLNGDGSTVTPVATSALQPDQKPVATDADYTKVLAVVLYVDYGSAKAATFAQANESQLESLVKAGYASLEIHPVALLSSKNGGYSTRAANALACVADHDLAAVAAVHSALLAAQSTAGKDGLSNDELVALVDKAGATTDADRVADCIRGGRFDAFVSDATTRAKAATVAGAGLPTIPTVVVDGKPYSGALDDASAFETFATTTAAAAAGVDAGSDGSATDGSATEGTTTGGTGATGAAG
ncbi:DsbA family protein [Naasia aerilata]|uniref:Thioredoxin-like fold domain-containing protein n=1 Tax=Naasia aerilata TaxID=1162966 RepID=A0ABN6XIP1_9MICO|nr:thioredoxin domain-containing protein [Naasia aerilata]BDZ44726.1 hypothetical protein GCM10025866_06350 [Naasia aerilata]